MNIYVSEDVPVPLLDFKDNQDVLDLIMKRPKGLIPTLDEEGIIPKGSAEGFLSKFAKTHATNPRFKLKQKTNELGVVHYAGEVYYDISLFLIKNKDTLSQDLIDVLSHSSSPFLESLFNEAKVIERESTILSFKADLEKSPAPSAKKRRSRYETNCRKEIFYSIRIINSKFKLHETSLCALY
jgi:myosin heavy subunit